MPNEMEQAREWLKSEQNRPEIEYLLDLLKVHQELTVKQAILSEELKRDREALRESSIRIANLADKVETQTQEYNELMRLYRVEKELTKDYGEKLAKVLNMLARVKEFCTEMEHYGLEG